ncbi:hypothetical protein CALVIDRAFT_258282 [Calocera viscosa TUFC12733]|uniref:Uncharacterized protein n=1 Tax=Calocera viscosa (strain TUFC12733) TaxID=1330018 RepID=A0A167J243_CALVF|nr:hypothetical protein CALVIDRAFT_258282 [Calocera viscosa TUFC12733]
MDSALRRPKIERDYGMRQKSPCLSFLTGLVPSAERRMARTSAESSTVRGKCRSFLSEYTSRCAPFLSSQTSPPPTFVRPCPWTYVNAGYGNRSQPSKAGSQTRVYVIDHLRGRDKDARNSDRAHAFVVLLLYNTRRKTTPRVVACIQKR